MTTLSEYANVFVVQHDGLSTQAATYTAVDPSEYSVTVNRGARGGYTGPHDLFVDERGNIFLCLSGLVKTYTYTLYYNSAVYSINNVAYTDAFRYLSIAPSSTTGTFTFTGSRSAQNQTSGRCDLSMKGPYVFTRLADSAASDVFNSTFLVSMGDIKTFAPIVSVDNVGHLFYVAYTDPNKEDFDVNSNNLPKATRTFFELLRLLVEWKLVADSPWNNDTDEIATVVDQFFSETKMTQEVIDDALANQCDMQVARYLKNDPNARSRPDVSEVLPASSVALSWVAQNTFHENIDVLYERCFPAS